MAIKMEREETVVTMLFDFLQWSGKFLAMLACTNSKTKLKAKERACQQHQRTRLTVCHQAWTGVAIQVTACQSKQIHQLFVTIFDR